MYATNMPRMQRKLSSEAETLDVAAEREAVALGKLRTRWWSGEGKNPSTV